MGKKKEEKKKLSSSEVARRAALKTHSTSITKERMSEIAKKAWKTRKKHLHEAYKSGKKKPRKRGEEFSREAIEKATREGRVVFPKKSKGSN